MKDGLCNKVVTLGCISLQLIQSAQKRDNHIKRIKDRDHTRKVAAEQRAEQRKRQDLDRQRREKREKRFVN